MCIDLIEDRSNAFLADVEDVEVLAERVAEIKGESEMREAVIASALLTAQNHSWSVIAGRYDEEVYRPLASIRGRDQFT